MKQYVQKKLTKINCEKLPISEFAASEELTMIFDESKNDVPLSILHAIAIGFANGIEYSQKKHWQVWTYKLY